MKPPIAILLTLPGSRPCFAARVHHATITGVKRKIISGFNDWNQVIGIENAPAMRSTPVSAHSANVLPDCSYAARKTITIAM